MAVQQIGLDYSWLVNLAKMQAEAEMYEKEMKAKPTPQATAIKEAKSIVTPYAGPTPTLAGEKSTYELEKEQRREDLLAEQTRKHEVLLKQMDIDAKLAEAISKERIASMGAEAGTEQAEIGAAGRVGAAQKTTMEKGYEFLDMLMKADEKTASGIITSLEAKRAEKAGEAGARPVSTIETGGVTMELPGATEEVAKDPNDPLTWLEDIGAYAPGAGAPRGKATGAAAKPEIDQYLDLIDDMMDKNPQSIVAITSGKGWDAVKENMRTIGVEAGFSEDVINAGIAMYEAIVPEFKEPSEEGGTLSKVWGGVETTAANIAPFIHQALHPGERTPEAEVQKQLWEESAGKVGEPSEAVKSFAELTERLVTGPFYPVYTKTRSKKTGLPVVKEPKAKEAGEITEQDVVTEMGTWDKEKIIEFQRAAKRAGLYKGPINGLHSNELDNVMKKYFKEHPEEWGEAK